MKVTNKIYATVQGSQLLGCSTNPYRDCEEYIRKDTLLEWANNALSLRRDTGDDYFYPAIVVLNDLIDKLNSL